MDGPVGDPVDELEDGCQGEADEQAVHEGCQNDEGDDCYQDDPVGSAAGWPAGRRVLAVRVLAGRVLGGQFDAVAGMGGSVCFGQFVHVVSAVLGRPVVAFAVTAARVAAFVVRHNA